MDRRVTIQDEILAGLGMVSLEVLADGGYRFMGQVPNWLRPFCELTAEEQVGELTSFDSPFLLDFLDEARSFWEARQPGRYQSGPWNETDAEGRDIALEASALCLKDKNVLLIQRLGVEHQERRSLLQKAREGALLRNMLEIEVRKRTEDIHKREEEIALRLIGAAEFRDDETGAHVRRIGLYSEVLARELGWSPLECVDFRIAAMMHDLGKIGIPDYILLKPSRLSDDEYTIMKTHVTIGAKMLEGSDVPLLKLAQQIALNHHEKWNGNGYPNGLKGLEIPESARIVSVVDVYDALISNRVYRMAMKEQTALAIMREDRGLGFDPDIFDLFMDNYKRFCEIQEECSAGIYPD